MQGPQGGVPSALTLEMAILVCWKRNIPQAARRILCPSHLDVVALQTALDAMAERAK